MKCVGFVKISSSVKVWRGGSYRILKGVFRFGLKCASSFFNETSSPLGVNQLQECESTGGSRTVKGEETSQHSTPPSRAPNEGKDENRLSTLNLPEDKMDESPKADKGGSSGREDEGGEHASSVAAQLDDQLRKRKKMVGSAAALEITAEEAAMSGAPTGVVYQVEVLSTEEIEPSSNPEEDLALVAEHANCSEWADQYGCIDAVRRLCLHHKEMLGEEKLKDIFSLLVSGVSNLRSSMTRNALLCLREMLNQGFGPQMKESMPEICSVLLQRMVGDKKFICDACSAAMDVAVDSEVVSDVLAALLPNVNSKNPEISSRCMIYVEKCLNKIGMKSKGAHLYVY